MADLLVRAAPVVLQDVVLVGAGGLDELLGDWLGRVSVVGLSFSYVGGRRRTRISARWSSGMSVSFSPWCLGMTSYAAV